MGAITDAVRRYVPATYNEMIIAPDDASRLFSTGDLQALADYVQFKLFATAADPDDEITVYGPYESQFLGKLTTLQYIPPAVDFWDSRLASLTSTGTNEAVTYRDHRDGLLKLYDILSKEVREDSQIFGVSLRKAGLLPQVSYGDGDRCVLKTPDPRTFPPLRRRHHTIPIPWETP